MKKTNKEKLFSYIVFIGAVLLTLFLFFIYKTTFNTDLIKDIIFYGFLVALCELFPIQLPKSGTVSISSVIIIASWLHFGPSFGPVPVVVINLFACIWPDIKKEFHIILFNCGQYIIAAGLAAWLYSSLSQVTNFNFNFPVPFIPFIMSIAVYHLLNSSLVSISIGFSKNISPVKIWLANARWTLPNYLSISILAVVFNVLFSQKDLGYISVALLLIPLIVARQTYQYYVKLKSAYSETVSSLIKAVEAKDKYIKGHSERVADISVKVGIELGLNEEDLESLKRIATLHDIGKIGIPKRVLVKPAELNDTEYEMIKNHPKIGAQILKNVEFLQELISAVYYHHERVDGTGYTSGLSGEQIPLFARIIAIADSYDAMTSDRAYRKALSKERVIEEFKNGMGTQFDATLVKCLFKALDLEEKPLKAIENNNHSFRAQPEKV